jgi:hypothetical protein
MAKSRSLLARLLNAPDLPAIVPRLQPEVLNRVIQTCGLESCSEVVALATPAQLARVFDLDLWRARAPGADERFDADRFGVWLEVLLDAGPEVAAEKLAGLEVDLVAGGLSQHVLVFDQAAIAPYTTLDGEQMPGRRRKHSHAADVGGYVIEARRMSAWDATVELLAFLAAEHGSYFHRLMRQCVRLSNGAREEDASHALLEDADQHMFDLAGDREGRREQQGYVTGAQAHAFLRSARHLTLDGDPPEPSALARAYFRAFAPPPPSEGDRHDSSQTNDQPVESALEVLREAGVLAPPPRALLAAGDAAASRLSWIESHVATYPESAGELAYLANAIVAGCSVQGRPFTEREAGDVVTATCNLGLENWPSGWRDRDLLTAFQVGWGILYREVCVQAANALIHALIGVSCADRDTAFGLESLRRDLIRHTANGEPWRARESLDVILALDAPAWAALLGLIAECPVLHVAVLAASQKSLKTVDADAFEFIATRDQIRAAREFMSALQSVLAGN